MRRLLAFALLAAPLALAAPQASAVDCSTTWWVGDTPVRGQDVNCWRNYADTRVQAVLDKLPPI